MQTSVRFTKGETNETRVTNPIENEEMDRKRQATETDGHKESKAISHELTRSNQ